jgi:hypothetical protein
VKTVILTILLNSRGEEMKTKSKTFMFLYKNMDIGGIETYLIRLIRQLKEKGNRVLWLTPADRYIDDSFKDDLLDGYVEIIEINTRGFNWIKHANINFNKNEEVIALSFEPFDFLRIETIKKEYSSIRIDSFYWVPHFKGNHYFIEEQVIWPLRPLVYKIIRKIIKHMEENDNIYYLNRSHLEAYERRYGYKVTNEKGKISGLTREVRPYDYNLALKRSIRNEFNIITVGRFDFPHKGYILGLIKVYGELKEKYSHLKLTIIGYGKDEIKVIEQIDRLSPNAKKDINLIGKVPYDDLQKYFKNAHLNIGVAGTIADGALTGLISIPVRHYSEVCEGYGYLPESRGKITADVPGVPIQKFIEEVIMMNQEEYLELSRKSYETYAKDGETNNIMSILNCKNRDASKTVSNLAIKFIKIYNILIKIIPKIKYEIRKIKIKIIRYN